MTQVQDMTDQQLNMALLELEGYKIEEWNGCARLLRNGEELTTWLPSEYRAWSFAPQYVDWDPDSRQIEERAVTVDAEGYVLNLSRQVAHSLLRKSTSPYYATTVARMLTATARQRAEAAYMTLSQIQGGSES